MRNKNKGLTSIHEGCGYKLLRGDGPRTRVELEACRRQVGTEARRAAIGAEKCECSWKYPKRGRVRVSESLSAN